MNIPLYRRLDGSVNALDMAVTSEPITAKHRVDVHCTGFGDNPNMVALVANPLAIIVASINSSHFNAAVILNEAVQRTCKWM